MLLFSNAVNGPEDVGRPSTRYCDDLVGLGNALDGDAAGLLSLAKLGEDLCLAVDDFRNNECFKTPYEDLSRTDRNVQIGCNEKG